MFSIARYTAEGTLENITHTSLLAALGLDMRIFLRYAACVDEIYAGNYCVLVGIFCAGYLLATGTLGAMVEIFCDNDWNGGALDHIPAWRIFFLPCGSGQFSADAFF